VETSCLLGLLEEDKAVVSIRDLTALSLYVLNRLVSFGDCGMAIESQRQKVKLNIRTVA